ncbi:MAG TPA: RNA 2',3'-cyclic phosphodiesterase [Candidatus Nanoarchaeia archaeon]|nr:RNA 2',3'-cyclic phosphodiesterase [Candidatus Nanoarchaeia archaeon]
MRIFIAIQVPEGLSDVFRRLQKALPRAGLILPRSFHLTLRFLGEVSEQEVAGIRKALRQVKVTPFSLATGSLGVFPSASFIQVVYAGIVGEGVRQLQKSVDAALQGIGIPVEKEAFSPHITIARVKSMEDKQAFATAVEAMPMERHEFAVRTFCLMKSSLAKGGAVHERLEEYG